MDKKSALGLLGSIVFLGMFVTYLIFALDGEQPFLPDSGSVVCTEEALLCPDGTGVGRSGPSCEFTPCPSQGSYTGRIVKQGEEHRLIIEAPRGIGTDVSYALPLLSVKSVNLDAFVGKPLTVQGMFTEGSTYRVTSVTEMTEEDFGTGGVEMGESIFLDGVRITLHGVVADYRCPVDAQCIEAGAIVANVTFESDTDSETFNMPSDEAPRPFDVWSVSIVDVQPPLMSGQEIEPGAYRVTFKVARLIDGKY